MNLDVQENPASIEKKIEEQELIYQEQLRKNSVFSVRKAIRQKIKELKEVLHSITNNSVNK